jgi:hypothetical protein
MRNVLPRRRGGLVATAQAGRLSAIVPRAGLLQVGAAPRRDLDACRHDFIGVFARAS